MGRIQRTPTNEQQATKEFLEYAKQAQEQIVEAQAQKTKIILSDGTITVFRPVILEDVRSLAKAGNLNPIEVAGRLIVRNCISWGDKPGIALPQLRNVDVEDVELISQALSPSNTPEFTELSDRSKSLFLGSGIEVIFRRPNYGDVEAISKCKGGELESQIALALRLCTKWGDRDSVEESILNQINTGDWQGVANLIKSFRSKPEND
ncbi:hypothetical protein I8748_31960 [Nostoc sp. CENA67]|uniref:Uncharacterized protein n=1 Tax=Amazonocrinis nigriterrae CENA67 TaxID=2794033 RepID=A0A8J7I1R4_9NOST|nr:hypothetical protein [Amazonocrinis nigriterrae]MBH8566714.1 hypothetical protein [Amazonocrinis nigriterrae CENA67]